MTDSGTFRRDPTKARVLHARPFATSGRGPACTADPDGMFPVDESERPGARTPGEARALAVCAGCAVLAECRTAVLALDGSSPLAYGVAGGMTREDRRAVRAASRRLSREASAVPALRAATRSGTTTSVQDAGWEAA